jgi:integrase
MAQYVLTAISPAMLARYCEQQLKQRAPQTVKHRLALLRRVFNVLRKTWGFTDLRNPVESIELPKVSNERQRRVETLPDGTNELDLILSNSESAELPAFARLAIETAARRSELARLLWADVDLEGRTAKLRKTKNGDPIREIPLSPMAVDLLRGLTRNGEQVFSFRADAYTKAWTRARHRAAKQCPTVATLNLHDGRHEGTSQLFEDGLSTMEVASVTGHKDLRMLRRYTHMQAKRLAEKIAKARMPAEEETRTTGPRSAMAANRQ